MSSLTREFDASAVILKMKSADLIEVIQNDLPQLKTQKPEKYLDFCRLIIERAEEEVKLELLNSEELPEEILLKAIKVGQHHAVRVAAVSHSHATENILIKALDAENSNFNQAIQMYSKLLSQTHARVGMFNALNNDHDIHLATLKGANVTEKVLLSALRESNHDLRVKLDVAADNIDQGGCNAAIPFTRKSIDNYLKVVSTVASHIKATETVLLEVLRIGSESDKMKALSNGNATEAVILAALDSGFDTVRIAAVSHPHVTDNILIKALQNDNRAVRKAAKEHPKMTPAIFEAGNSDRIDAEKKALAEFGL